MAQESSLSLLTVRFYPQNRFLTTADLTVTQAVVGLGVSRKTLSWLFNGQASLADELIAERRREAARENGA
jgi:hypothetical protein